jgi:hypothetical protein
VLQKSSPSGIFEVVEPRFCLVRHHQVGLQLSVSRTMCHQAELAGLKDSQFQLTSLVERVMPIEPSVGSFTGLPS